MGLSVGSDLLQMDKACRVFNRQPNKLRPLTFLALLIGSWSLASFSPTQLGPITPHANTAGGFLKEEVPGSSSWFLHVPDVLLLADGAPL